MSVFEKLFVHEPLFSLCYIALSFVVAFAVQKILNYSMKSILKKLGRDNGMMFIFARRIVSAVIYVLAVFAAFQEVVPLRNIGTALLGVSSIFTVVVALGAQEVASDLVSGIILSAYEPFRRGDFISIPSQNISGTVVNINLRHCELSSPNNTRIIVPNKVLNGAVIENRISRDGYRNIVTYSVSYESDLSLAKSLITEFLKGDGRVTDKGGIGISAAVLNDSSVDLRVVYTAEDFAAAKALEFEMNEYVLKSFKEKGIDIPYPHLVVKNS